MNHERHDQVELLTVAVATSWTRLLRVHRRRLPAADLEDCLAQALLELFSAAKQGRTRLTGSEAAVAALDQRFQSRIIDRQRAQAGRSPITAALHYARALDTSESTLAGPTGWDPLQRVLDHETLSLITSAVAELTADQRLALLAELNGERPGEFCARTGWSIAKYRKTLQRARTRLRVLLY